MSGITIYNGATVCYHITSHHITLTSHHAITLGTYMYDVDSMVHYITLHYITLHYIIITITSGHNTRSLCTLHYIT